MCGGAQSEQGGLLFDPPTNEMMSKKTHLCTTCHYIVKAFIAGARHEMEKQKK